MRNAQTQFVFRRQMIWILMRVVQISCISWENVIILRFTYAARIACCLLLPDRVTAERVEALRTSRQLALLLQQDRKYQLRSVSLLLRYVTGCMSQHSTCWMLFNYQWGTQLQSRIKSSIILSEFVAKVVCIDQFMIRLRSWRKSGLSVKATHDAMQ